ncbi:MAG TPA: hypothetical protein VIN10_06325 [Bacteroidales bacterium]
MKKIQIHILFVFLIFPALLFSQQKTSTKKKNTIAVDTIYKITSSAELEIAFSFTPGKEFNHPTFALWIEDIEGNYLETIFVTRSFATGIYGHGDAGDGKWKTVPGESIRIAALPYWSHKRNVISRDTLYIPTPENPLPDALTGATPENNFVILTNYDKELPRKFVILFEINQAFDYNEFWTNLSLNQNPNYLTSGQPSVIYAVTVDLGSDMKEFFLNPIGHGSATGKDGLLYTNLQTITTAGKITGQAKITIID